MPSLFGFGKRRRKVKRSSKKAKASRKPPARLLKICKKYHVKATKKVGGRRCYKSIACLKRLCLKKARAMKKKLMKMAKRKKSSKKTTRRRTNRRRTSMGQDEEEMNFGARRSRFGNVDEEDLMSGFGKRRRTCRMDDDEMMFGARRRIPMFGRRYRFGGEHMMPDGTMMDDNEMMFGRRSRFGYDEPEMMDFGKRRGGAKVSKAKAMKAFRSFYKRHCKGRGARFGNGGNPMLNASMGYEFCPNGMGGVLGANSTGLFPSPCMSSSSSGMAPRPAAPRPPAPRPPAPRPPAPRPPAPRPAAPRKPAFGVRRRRSTATGDVRRRRRSTATGDVRRRRRSTAAGGARRRRCSMYN